MAAIVFNHCIACNQQPPKEHWLKIHDGQYDEIGTRTGYINISGDTVVALGKYHYCYTDTFRYYAIVSTVDGKCVAIDQKENQLFEVFWVDNGPDYISEGLFRIVKDGKIGYANTLGEIVIEPLYQCAFPFKDGEACVSYNGKALLDGEHTRWESNVWIVINKEGQQIR